MGIANLNWPSMEDASQMSVMELRRNYRFLREPETQEELDVLAYIGERLQENGLMTLPVRASQTKDLPDSVREG